jgi:hypothetical protein
VPHGLVLKHAVLISCLLCLAPRPWLGYWHHFSQEDSDISQRILLVAKEAISLLVAL